MARRFFLWFTVFFIVGIVATMLICNITYSKGYRAGVLIKFAEKGFLFKTYEGDLNMGGVGNVPNTAQINQIWNFSVSDKDIADKLNHAQGKKVSLHYREVIKSFFWQGETNYFVDGVEIIE